MSVCTDNMKAITIFILRGAFVVARFDNQGNAKAFTQWNGQQDWLHVFMLPDVGGIYKFPPTRLSEVESAAFGSLAAQSGMTHPLKQGGDRQ